MKSKVALLLAVFTLSIQGAFANIDDGSNSECEENISRLIGLVSGECFAEYVDTDNQYDQADEDVKFSSCMRYYTSYWNSYYSNACAKGVAKNACLEKCDEYSFGLRKLCFFSCPKLN